MFGRRHRKWDPDAPAQIPEETRQAMLRTLRGMEFHKLVAAQQYCAYTGERLNEKTCSIVIDDTGAFVTLVSPEAAHNIRWTPRLQTELAERGHRLLPGQGHDALTQDEPARRTRDAHPLTEDPPAGRTDE